MTGLSEKAIMNAALVAVSRLPRAMFWRNNSGMAWQGRQIATRVGQTVTIRPGMMVLEDARPITFGLPGSGDLLGVHDGQAWALEGKTLHGRQAEQQARFQAAFEAAGGRYAVFRSAEQAIAAVRGK